MMTLTQKIGQLFIFGIPSIRLEPEVRENLKRWQPGGIIFFSRNLESPEQTLNLTTEITQSLNPELPLWFCVDQEGGVVVRLTHGVSVFPGNMALGATASPKYAYETGKQTALEWSALGVNLNLAPVLDLSYPENPGIGVRSFGQDKHLVSQLGVAQIKGMQENGMSATAKHFPGKGLAKKDSHLDLPYIDIFPEDLFNVELFPFIKAIEAKVDCVMSSHCIYKQVDAQNPGTLSPGILNGLLRKKLGFKGLVISDDLEMGAILKTLPVEEAALKFLLAGGDQVLVCHSVHAQEKVFQRMRRAVKENEFSEALLDEKLERISKIKKERASRVLKKKPIPVKKNLAKNIARASISIIHNEAKLIPIQSKYKGHLAVFCVDYAPLTQVEEGGDEQVDLKGLLDQTFQLCDFKKIPLQPDKETIKSLIAQGIKAEMLLIFTYNAHMYSEQVEWVKACAAGNPNTIVCALRNPYDLNEFSEVKHYIASYGFRDSTLRALVEVLSGQVKATGKCPTELLTQPVS